MTNPVFLGGSAPDPPRADVVDRGVDLVAAALDMLDWEEDPAFARKVVERLLVDRRVDAHTVFYLARRFSEPQLDRIRPLLSSGEGAAPAMVAAVFVKLKRKRALPDILPLLDGGHAVARLYAGRMLVRHGTAAHKAWALRAARDHSADVRQYGVAALARIADEESLLRLRAGLGDWAEQVRETAATELAHVAGIAPGEVEAFVEDFKKGDVGRATVDDVVANEALRPILLAVARKKVPRIKLAAPRAARRAEAVRRLAARWSPRRPKIDGRADDRAWADAAPAGRFTLDDGGAPRHQTTVSAIYDEDALYLLFQCDEPDIDRLITLYTETDSNVWLDDSIDIYLFPRGTEKEGSPPYYRLSANARGTQFDERRRNRDWNASWTAAASKGEKGWTLEVSVPFRNFLIRRPDRNKTTWRVNFVRHRRIPPEEDSVFQKGDPREPATNAVLKFE
ncbi:MAG: sugar-binding protein [Planctomycetota bacterium]